MSDEIRQLATAIEHLAISNQGIGGALREQIAISQAASAEQARAQGETNAMLGRICKGQDDILEQMKAMGASVRESQRAIRVLKETHGQRLDKIEERVFGQAPTKQ
jgi:hypothetical protein